MLRDRIKPGVRVLFVGINPGQRSEAIGHHFAGYSNRFWPLLYDSKLVTERISAEDDDRLPEWGLGVTNLVPRMTPGIDTLKPQEYVAGARVLRRKIRRVKPYIVALVGVSIYRSLFNVRAGTHVSLGLQTETLEGARVFVLPNPSGRNANFSYGEMLAAFRALRRISAVSKSRNAS
ncbi:MAG TPA: mismatch-specific DNA-glycosylase [Vicinamibacterales bacterium]|nr:mismatch-specific DNA-glycosylase [Vicinamibacterales bacterium]